jgi:superfamily II DNA/RNA helicase
MSKLTITELKNHLKGHKGLYKLKKDELVELFKKTNYERGIQDIDNLLVEDLEEYKEPIITAKPKASQIGRIFKNIYKTSQFNEKEQEEFVKENALEQSNLFNPHKSDTQITLQKHQVDFVEKFFQSPLNSAIMFHGVGSGKTLTAVASANFYLAIYPNNKIYVVSPPALLPNFIKELQKLGLNIRDNRFKYLTYMNFIKLKPDLSNALVFIDEAHNFRTLINVNITEQQIETLKEGKIIVSKEDAISIKTGKNAYYVEQILTKAHKIILLTGTPFINSEYDIQNLLVMCDRNLHNLGKKEFYSKISDPRTIKDMFRYKISHYERHLNSKDFPERREFIIPLIDNQMQHRTGLENPFYIDSKSNSNTTGDLKTKEIIKICKTGRTIIFSQYLERGAINIMNKLNDNNLPYVVVSGAENSNKKAENIKRYNNNDVSILIITKAGSEGVDTKNTRNIILNDNVWTDGLSEQVIARAIRYKSHNELPESERYVNVYRLVVCKDKDLNVIDDINDGKVDFISVINGIKEFKKSEKLGNNEIDEYLKDFSGFDKKTYRALTTKQEKEKYLDSLSINKNISISSDFRDIEMGSDLYLYIYMKSKQQKIDKFIKLLDKTVPELEDYKSKFESEFLDFIIGYQKDNNFVLNEKERNRIEIEALNTERLDGVKQLEESIQEAELRDKEINHSLKQGKLRAKKYQEFFTPKSIVLKMLNFSKFYNDSDDKAYTILEPTAGCGNIVKELLKINNKKMVIDMVEIQPYNRQDLREVVKLAPDILNLCEQPDFLKFEPNKGYDFIVMNPPFHLRKSLIPSLSRDMYDMDFVIKAYDMLKVGGELIAIVATKNAFKKEFSHIVELANRYESFNTKWKGTDEEKVKTINSINLTILQFIKTV